MLLLAGCSGSSSGTTSQESRESRQTSTGRAHPPPGAELRPELSPTQTAPRQSVGGGWAVPGGLKGCLWWAWWWARWLGSGRVRPAERQQLTSGGPLSARGRMHPTAPSILPPLTHFAHCLALATNLLTISTFFFALSTASHIGENINIEPGVRSIVARHRARRPTRGATLQHKNETSSNCHH